MRKLLHYYYQNKRRIWKIILIIALIFAIIRGLNEITKNNTQQMLNTQNLANKNNVIQNNTTTNAANISTTIESTNALVSGGTVSESKLTEAQNIINEFIENCNNKKIEEAYNILTDECKEQMYPTVEDFYNNYWNSLFDEKKLCTITNWSDSIYKVNIIPDMLSTGKVSAGGTIDYITVVKEERGYKLNINSYIGRKTINKNTETKDIQFKVLSKDVYMDYEVYNIQVMNNTENTIMLDSLNTAESIYLYDTKGTKYSAVNYELAESGMFIKSGTSRKLKIKFTNGYSSSRYYNYIAFTSAILNYEENTVSEELVIEL